MTDELRPDDVFEIEPTDSEGILARLPWWLIGTLAVLVTEITTHPAIGVVVFCVKFGWNDFLTALWLRRRDPHPTRGRVCSWFYGASGLWRVCISSFALMFFLVPFFVLAAQRPAGGLPRNGDPAAPPLEFVVCMIVWLTSSAAATILTSLAVVIARRFPTKIWVSTSVSNSRRQNEWPPQFPPSLRRSSNVLKWWLILATIVVFVPLYVVGVGALFAVNGGPPRGPAANGQNWAATLIQLAVLGTPMVGAFAILAVCGMICDRLAAKTPWEGWPIDGSMNVLAAPD